MFKKEICKKSDWFNGDTYGDNLNPKSVKTFIKTTYERYLKEVGEEFGKTIPGIFTDELNIFSGHNPGLKGLPWTDILSEYFKEKRGYELLEGLPYLFFEGERAHKMRYDFWRTITELFVESYSKQIGKWCKEHNIIFTGHYLYENEFPQSIIASGAIMPHYQYQGIPGIDILTESIRETLTVKQCSSIVNQFRKKRLISELYGCTGWEFTFEGQKWVGDWQYALGVNLRCQHLALYSLRGCRKRDYPPSFNYNTTWWKYNKVIEDYFARLSFILSEGEVVREILLIHPIESAWMIFNGSNIEEVSSIGRGLQEIADTLLALHRDFDLGDESIIENYGKVFGSEFVVNEASYKLVILPPMKTIRASTVKLLKEFLDSGGKIISVTPHPDMVEAKREDLSELFTHPNVFILTDRNKLGDTIDNDIFFIVNIDRENSHMVEIIINN
ncbi:MAG: glycosyl hydrolase, partial [bacterium]